MRAKKLSQPSGGEVAKEGGSTGVQKPAGDAVQIKKEHQEEPPKLKANDSQPEVINLLDSPPPSPKRSFANSASGKQVTIKSEPFDFSDTSKRASTYTIDLEGRGTKKIKLEPGKSSATPSEDPDHLRLNEEDERQEEELLAAQRVAQLLRERNERKARIAAMEQSRRSGTSNSG